MPESAKGKGGRPALRLQPEYRDMTDEEFEVAIKERKREQIRRSRQTKISKERTKRARAQIIAGGRDLAGNYAAEAKAETKAKDIGLKAAVIASLYLGESEPKIAAQYNLSLSRIARIRESFNDVGSIQRRDWLTETLVIYIQQEIKSLMAISIVTSDEEWVLAQSADGLATFIATKSDKLTQLLQSFGRVATEREQYIDQLDAVVQEIH